MYIGGANFSLIDEWREYISPVFIFAFLIQLAKFAKIEILWKFLLIQYFTLNECESPYELDGLT